LRSWQQASNTHKNGTEVNSVGHLDTNPRYAKDHLSGRWLWKNCFIYAHVTQASNTSSTQITSHTTCANWPGEIKLQSKGKFEFNIRVFWIITRRSLAGDPKVPEKPAASILSGKCFYTENHCTFTTMKSLESHIQFKSITSCVICTENCTRYK
jgi:hypothetical protein